MSSEMYRVLAVALLLICPTLGAPQLDDDRVDELEEPDVAWSEEATTQRRLDLEDPVSWSASTEVLDENHAWYRRRRAVPADGTSDAAEDGYRRRRAHPEDGGDPDKYVVKDRRRRAVPADGSRVDAAEDVAKDDLEPAESVVFMPSHLRARRRRALEECSRGRQEFTRLRRQTSNMHAPVRSRCNSYCCYPVLRGF